MPSVLRAGRSRLTAVLATLWITACASATYEARPEQIPSLEEAAARAPANADLATRLGVAYFMAGRHEDARRTLNDAIAAGATDGAAFLYLGLASEELEDFTAARAAYNRYLETGSSSRVRGQIRNRLALVARRELQQEARLALRQEQILSDQPPTPNTVAVLPFRLADVPDELAPLRTALADMIITDLSFTPLQSLERVRVQSMFDEMVLVQAGLTADQTGPRMGRLLKAAHVVQGVLSSPAGGIALDASVLDVDTRSTRPELSRRGAVDDIFDLEKQIVYDIIAALGITLTAREREQIESNRTGSLVAFLAYGQGLEALDRGDFGAATQHFQQAAQLDPGFAAARTQRAHADQLGSADATGTEQVGDAGTIEVGAPAAGALAAEIANQVNYSPAGGLTQGSPSQERTPTTEQQPEPTTSQAARTTMRIIVPNPTGGGS
jgi:tetratricopeptide (TPR) repeat protein